MYNSVTLEDMRLKAPNIGGDINSVKIDTNANVKKRVSDYIEQIHNPYCFKCENTLVRVTFNPKGIDLENAIMNYFSNLQEI